MGCQVIRTDKAPAAIGPYSQGIKVGQWLYVSGQLGLVPGT
ncbi:MAG: RidA family protein, partial [Deltaproteobacteria bacterium]